jgi:predicted O-methyltransferase YrrM
VVQRYELDLAGARARLQAIGGEHAEPSGLFPDHEAPGRPNSRLISLMQALTASCPTQDLPLLQSRGAPSYVFEWPGEHYRLLASLVRLVKPGLVVEIGTYTGHSALAMIDNMAAGARLATFDIVRWNEFANTLLVDEDFADGRLVQLIADLSDPEQVQVHASLLRGADIVFVDASKDGSFERRLLANLETVGLKRGALVVFDDIRLWNMLGIWRGIERPKLDLTSLGHYSGTGIVDWTDRS